jgi:hypothetical protein
MKYLLIALSLLVVGCNDTQRIFDSEIVAIREQTRVIKEQNLILNRIAKALEKKEVK